MTRPPDCSTTHIPILAAICLAPMAWSVLGAHPGPARSRRLPMPRSTAVGAEPAPPRAGTPYVSPRPGHAWCIPA
jgi:hypothetical protein